MTPRERQLEAEVAELRRDYAELVALDGDGLKARVVELEDIVEQRADHIAQLQATLAAEQRRSSEFYDRARMLEHVSDIVSGKVTLDDLRASRDRYAADATEANRALVTRFYEAFARRDGAAGAGLEIQHHRMAPGLGQTLGDRAAQQFAAVRQLQSQVPPTIDHRGRLADPCILATLAMLRPLVASKRISWRWVSSAQGSKPNRRVAYSMPSK